MSIPVEITNTEITDWYQNQNDDRAALQTQTLLLTGLFAAQLVLYYALWDDAIDKRDAALDKYQDILDYAHDQEINVDYQQLLAKQDVLDLALPEVNMCEDAQLFEVEVHNDGQAIDDKCFDLSKSDCCSPPPEWKNHEGQLYAARAQDYTGGILANAAKRRREAFLENKVALALRAQQSARTSLSSILNNYTQAVSIYEGLASTFLQGFNSAGAGLGVNIARLGQSSASSGTTNAAGAF